jgi:hypothetical protein
MLGTLLAVAVQTVPAQAQATRTWVSGVGDDANPCSRTAPCKTFAGAISKTAAGGEIDCIDPGGFGAVTITKSITIDCGGTFGSILAAGTNGVNVNDGATASPGTIVVTLRNLSINGAGTGLVGINFTSGAVVHVVNCQIFGFKAGTAEGIHFAPPAGVAAELMVTDSYIADNGNSGVPASAGIQINPAGTGSAKVLVDNTHFENNNNGFRATGVGSTGGIRATVRNSTASGNTFNGFISTSPGGAVISLFLERNASVNNLNGVGSDGNQSFVNISRNVITSNNTGIFVSNGGLISSYTTNFIDGNISANGAPNGSLTPK